MLIRRGAAPLDARPVAAKADVVPDRPGNIPRRRCFAGSRAGGAGDGLRPPAARQFFRHSESLRVPDRSGFSSGGLALQLLVDSRGAVSAGLPDDPGRIDRAARGYLAQRSNARRVADRPHRSGAGGIRGAAADGGRIAVLSDAGAAPQEQEGERVAGKTAAAYDARQSDQRLDGDGIRAADAGRDFRGDLGLGRIRHALDRCAANSTFVIYLAAVPGDDFPPRLGRLERQESRRDGAGRARMRRADVGRARRIEARAFAVTPMKLLITG